RDGTRGAGADTLSVRLTAAPLALDRVVVTAARREQRLADAIVTTEVVGRREIERSGATDLAAVLTEQTGIQLHGGHPSGSGVMLQGIGAERVLVLLDGQPLVGRISGNFDLSRIPTGMVERVEVVKGPQSTLYGSEAMGGVINIVTRMAPDVGWEGTVTALGGTDGRRDLLLGGSAAVGAWGAVADGGMRTIERAPGRAGTTGALADRYDGSLKLRWAPDGDRTWVEASGFVVDERQRWQSGTLFDFADNRQLGARLGASRLFGEQRLTSTLHLSQFDHLARSSRTPIPVAGTGDEQVQRLAEAELLYTGSVGGLAVDAGVEARQEYISSSDGRIPGEDGGTSRTLLSAEPFAQVELGGGDWSVVPGARLTWNEQWGSHLTPRLAARWRPVDGLTLRASVGRGFRAPDFKELYLQFSNDNAGYVVYGNPDLRPEHSDNVTLGAEWSAGRLYTRAQLFHNRLRDFIETRPLPSDGSILLFEYANVEQGLTRGAELEGGVAVGSLRAEAAYSYLDAEDRATGLPLLGRPTHSARATLGGMLPFELRASVTALYTGATPMERDDTGAVVGERDAFFRTDVRLARRLPRGLEIVAGADNLFDQRPARWEGAVARQVYAALSWSIAR
ncbi:MAG TPA: TonB-dependent receptor, partial [Gemmatimonadales bacterium]